ncbi:hypothetical protein SERLADRAFT_380636, partial [Serpula lacrymans var. lacrymans S7.9]
MSAEFEALKIQFTHLDTESGPSREDLDKKIADLTEIVKADQSRLYSRLHNSRCTVLKTKIKAPPTA